MAIYYLISSRWHTEKSKTMEGGKTTDCQTFERKEQLTQHRGLVGPWKESSVTLQKYGCMALYICLDS